MSELKYVPTVCPYCSCGCGMYLMVKNGEIVGREPWKEHPVNEGKNCIKGSNAYKCLYSKDRLKKPLIRKNDGLEEATWNNALELAAEKIKHCRQGFIGFINSGKMMNEDLYVMQKLARVVLKTNNIDNCSRFCHSTTVPALISTVGSGVMVSSTLSIEEADCIIIAGANTLETYPLLSRRIYKAKNKGALIIAVDPRITVTMQNLANMHLQINPGADTALINGIMKIIVEEDLQNNEFIKNRTMEFEELKKYLLSLDINEIEKITGIKVKNIREVALDYAKAKIGCILYCSGIAQHANGIESIKALSDLALLTGNYGKPGSGVNPLRGHSNGEGFGDMGPIPVFYPGFKRVNKESAEFFEKIWDVKDLPAEPGMTYMDMLEKCKILYTAGANPMVSAPDSNKVRGALEKLEFLIVQDIFRTETTEMADIVLPAAAWTEREGTITGVDRRVQKINKATPPIGEAKPDWIIFCELAAKMGFKEKFNYKSSQDIFEEIRRCVPQYAGITYNRLGKSGGIQWPCPSENHPGTPIMFTEKFATPDGRGHFQIAEYKPALELPDKEYPYIFISGRVMFHFHTGTMTRRTDKLANETPEGFIEINPKDATKLAISDGNKITLKSRRGEIKITAKVVDRVHQGVVFAPYHFSECSANSLTGPTAGPPSQMPEFKFCAVRIER